ncbi:MAG: tetratricopeptide repeat protein, partial [Desulfuromonadales bacterium]
MSLINQMLRDLQQRRDGQPGDVRPNPAGKTGRYPHRSLSLANLLRSVPPLLWVGAGGLAGLLLLWGGSDWLSGVFSPNVPVPLPPPELVAFAEAPQPLQTGVPEAAKRRTPSVPIDLPSPAPPRAYGSVEPSLAVLPPAAPEPRSTPGPTASVQRSMAVVPPQSLVALPGSPTSGSDSRGTAAGSPSVPPVVPGVVANPPGRLHPDLLPGAVNATNLALQKSAREVAAVPPPVVTPYGRAEDAYREGRQAYEDNHPDVSLEALRRAMQFYPGHLLARELLADQLEMAGRIDEAFALLTQGLTIAPDYTPFRKRAARMLLDRGDAAGATRVLTGNGLPRVEDDPELHRLLAGVYQQLGENFLAAQTYRNLLVHDPQSGGLWVGLGDAL